MPAMYQPVRSLLAAFLLFSIPSAGQAQISFSIREDDSAKAEEKIELSLLKHGSIDFVDTPLSEVAVNLQRQFQVTVVLATRKLEEAAIGPDTPVTKKLNDLPFNSILRLTLGDLGLAFKIEDCALIVTTPEDASSQLDTRIYPVLDLVVLRPDMAGPVKGGLLVGFYIGAGNGGERRGRMWRRWISLIFVGWLPTGH